MKGHLKHIVAFLIILFAFSTNSLATFADGIKAFEEAEFKTAAKKFDSIITSGTNDVSAVFNFGLSNMKAKNYGKAIWAFEKVLIAQPNDVEAKELIRECFFNIDSNFYWEYRLSGFQSSMYSISSNLWAILSILLSFILALSIVFFRKNSTTGNRRLFLISGFFSALFFLLFITIGYFSKEHKQFGNYAIITKKNVKSLHEKTVLIQGSLVEILTTEIPSDEIRVETIDGEILTYLQKDLDFI